MEAFLNIKYKQVSISDNYEELLKFFELGMLIRKTALTIKPVCIVAKEGDVYTLTMSSSFKTIKTTFKPNEEFDDERVDGKKVKSVVTVDGNKLIHVQTTADGKKIINVREFFPDKVLMTTSADGFDGVVSRVFEKID